MRQLYSKRSILAPTTFPNEIGPMIKIKDVEEMSETWWRQSSWSQLTPPSCVDDSRNSPASENSFFVPKGLFHGLILFLLVGDDISDFSTFFAVDAVIRMGQFFLFFSLLSFLRARKELHANGSNNFIQMQSRGQCQRAAVAGAGGAAAAATTRAQPRAPTRLIFWWRNLGPS